QACGVELAPSLVENHPHDDARVVVQSVQHGPQLEFELPGRLGRTGDFPLLGRDPSVTAGHILPDQEAQLIAPVIPTLRLDLDVLTRQIEAEFLGYLDIVLERFIRRSGVDSVRPEALVERAELEHELAIEEHARDSFIIFADLDLAHAEVTL